MHLNLMAIIFSIIGLVTSLIVVGIVPSVIALVISIFALIKEKSINVIRALAMSVVGILVPLIMYFNCYGLGAPSHKDERLGFLTQIIYDNYSNMGFNMEFLKKSGTESNVDTGEDMEAAQDSTDNEEMYYVSDGKIQDKPGYAEPEKELEIEEKAAEEEGSDTKIDNEKYDLDIFEKLEDVDKDFVKKPLSTEVGASDDDMPSYGGLPVGTLLIAQYFREDDHNCNPVLVLQNKTGSAQRYECRFTARDDDGEVLAYSEKTVEVVEDGAKFVFEGRFDKNDLGKVLPSMYEFSISKRTPYEKSMTGEVVVYAKAADNSVILAAENVSSKKVKVDAFVLFFDKDELVDCIWLIPENSDEVCVDPGTVAAIKGDAYYRFDRIETYYTAYEAVSGR